MSNFVKKTKKLILHPQKFFADRQRKIDAAKKQEQIAQKAQTATIKPAAAPKPAAKPAAKPPAVKPPAKPAAKPAAKPVAKPAAKPAPVKPKPHLKVYIHADFTESTRLLQHVKSLLGKYVNIHIGNYRFAKSTIVFDLAGQVYPAELSSPIENNIFVKGFLLLTPKETLTGANRSSDKLFADITHKINVEHMKSISDFNLLYKYYENRPERNEQSQVKYALNAGVYESDIIRKAITLLESPTALNPKDTIFTFRKVYRVIGTDQRLEIVANRLAATVKKEPYPTDFIMLLAAFFTESGDFKRALEMAEKAKSKDSAAWSKYRFLALGHLLYSAGLSDDTAVQQDHDLFLRLTRNEWEFENYLTEHFGNLAIVGNSPIELSKRKGATIDAHTKVLRFNSAITDFPHCIDYGKKTSVLITNPRYYETQRNRKHELDFILISDGNLFSTRDLFYKVNDLSQFTDKICLLPRKVDLSLTQKICASPSSGLKFLTWLYEISGPIPDRNLFGFSLTDQAHGVATSYSSGRKVGLNTIHNWSSEKIALEQLVFNDTAEEIAE
ncbi:glycosyltransferase family 29 protein [Pseudomonas plecoglossicida]|uniref:glycosyltransferase family 29 protein n=2 Tax=Pseudomonas TaxID=286 RepID=UPI0009E7095C|nr:MULTISPECIES: glycosyltransferase family 29 protein [Pseudomonas]MDQ7967591.1 glycosyltransferase family 29 protein [Pseudomonas plecoglossicida]WFG01744.1 glycosyltransferase family 29 protein [Pseudomonas putida]HDS0941517.1 glycosyltransferase family 29 protein [Pseudomonas putida]